MFGRKNKEEEERIKPKKKEEDNDWQWDRKRLFILAIVLFVLVIGFLEFKDKILPENSSILGESAKIEEVEKPQIKTPQINFSRDVESVLGEVKNSIENLSPEEVASSSPQVQKVLKDIEQIKNLPANQARDACMKLCSSI
jgi:hypothetical protein